MKKINIAAFLILFFILSAPTAYALSCAPPVLDRIILEDAKFVFEGIPGQRRALTEKELDALEEAGRATKGGMMSEMKAIEFTVTKSWKGPSDGETIWVFYNTYWGDVFTEGANFFVLIPKSEGGFNISPLCGHTMHMEYAESQGFLKVIEEVFHD